MDVQPKKPTTKGPAEWFTGDVSVGQTLHVTDGLGYVQSRGGELLVRRPGDTVHTPPGEWHWHGATADRFMSHLALGERPDADSEPETEWGAHVTEEEYPS